MKPNVYIPSPVLLPVEIANSSAVQAKLMDYMKNIKLFPKGKESFVEDKDYRYLYLYTDSHNGYISFKKGNTENHVEIRGTQVSIEEPFSPLLYHEAKITLLKHPVPLYHDVFLVNNKILATGSYLPGLYDLIGKPLLFLRRKGSEGKASSPVPYFYDNLNANIGSASYLVIEDFPLALLHNPIEWELIFQFRDFEHCINLQKNPFANATPKTTLNTMQKDNPTEWISEWCNYYFHHHGVERVVIYNNGALNLNALPNLLVSDHIEIWYVEWTHLYQQSFARCQTGGLTHAYWWLGSAAKYFLNFDIDEYLVNESGFSLLDYVQRENAPGLSVDGYIMPENAMIPNIKQTALSLKKTGKAQKNSAYKYIYQENYWHHLNVHKALRLTFFLKPRFWILLETSSKNILFIVSKSLYPLSLYFFRLQRFLSRVQKLSLQLPQASDKELYFLHYNSRKTGWKSKPFIQAGSD